MTDKQRSQKEVRLNDAARAWKEAEAIQRNGAEAMKLKEEVWILAYELAEDTDLSQLEKISVDDSSHKKQKKEDKRERDISVLSRALEEAMTTYNASVGPFSHYFSMLLKKRDIDSFRHNKVFNPADESLDREISLQTGDTVTLGDAVPSDVDVEEDTVVRIRLLSMIVEQTSLVLDFFHRHTGRAANETRRMWYRLFFTEDMTNVCKQAPSILEHPRDVFHAMDLGYLDHYMSKPCRTPSEVKRTPLKPYCDVVPDSDDPSTAWLEDDFPGDVSLFYLLKTTGNKPGRSARSNQLKFYREEMRGLL